MTIAIALIDRANQDYRITSGGKDYLMHKHHDGRVFVKRGDATGVANDLPTAFNQCVRNWNSSNKVLPWWWNKGWN